MALLASLISAALRLKMLYHMSGLIAICFGGLGPEALLVLTMLACLSCCLGLRCFMGGRILAQQSKKLSLEE